MSGSWEKGLSDLPVGAPRMASCNLSLTAQIPSGSPGGEKGLPRWPRSAGLAREHFVVTDNRSRRGPSAGTVGPLSLRAPSPGPSTPNTEAAGAGPRGSEGLAPDLTKSEAPADGLTKSGKKATAFLLSILKSCGMSTMSRSARPSSRFSTSRFQSMQLWGGARSQGGLAGAGCGGWGGPTGARLAEDGRDAQVPTGQPSTRTSSLCAFIKTHLLGSPRHRLTPWQGARQRGSGCPVLHPLPSPEPHSSGISSSYRSKHQTPPTHTFLPPSHYPTDRGAWRVSVHRGAKSRT